MSNIPQDIPQKQCSKCPNSYPATLDFFPGDKRRKLGLASDCRNCRRENQKRIYQEKKEERKAWQKLYRETYPDRVAESKKQYYEKHKDEDNARRRQYRQDHLDQEREHKRLYRLNHLEEEKARCKQNYLAHRQERLEHQRAYHVTEKGKSVARASRHKRRAQEKAIGGTLTSLQVQTKLKAQRHKCYYCQKKFEKLKGRYVYHLEHTIPLSRTEENPQNDVNYVVLACPACNQEKHNKLPHEWTKGGRLL